MVFEQNSNFSTVWAWENEATKKRGDGIRKSKVPFLTSFMIASGQVYLPKKDGKKLVDLLERLELGHSRWNYRCLSRLLEFNWSNEIGLNRGCFWILNRSNYKENSAKFCFLLIFCLPLSWASVTRCCWIVQKKSKQITDDYWRVLLQSTF